MKKLFNLKKWLTLDEAARHLTIVFGEDVCVADVLRLALDGHLKLSFNFVNHVRARKGKVIPIEEASYDTMPPLFTDLFIKFFKNLGANDMPASVKSFEIARGINLDDKHVLELEDQVSTLIGVYDLPMLGRERLDFEQMYQMLTGGPKVALGGMIGALVCGGENVIYELQEGLHLKEFYGGPDAELRQIKAQKEINNMESLRARELLEGELAALEISIANEESNRDSGKERVERIPAGRLSEDCACVVRTEALNAFEQSVSDEPDKPDKPLTTTEKTSLLLIIAAFCKNKSIDPASRDAVGKVQNLISSTPFKIDDDTVRKFLRQIPEAIERRTR